jgi:taurine-pyruvate aminotransferase
VFHNKIESQPSEDALLGGFLPDPPAGAGPDAEAYLEDDRDLVWHHLTRHEGALFPLMVKGEGLRLWDVNGKEYLDATSGGVWCVNLGYGRKEIVEAAAAQLLRLPYYVGSAGNLPSVDLARALLKHAPGLSRVYFSSSGSEANEKAFKMIRLVSYLKKDSRSKILYRDRDYHGTTLGALSSCGQKERSLGFGPFVPGFEEVPAVYCYRCSFKKSYPDCDLECARAVEEVILRTGPETVGGAVFETVTAGGGILVPPPEYWPEVQSVLKKYDVALILDEVVTGLGRTGAMFAYDHYGIQPDLLTLAKGVASAYLPISLTLATEKIFQDLQSGSGVLGYFRDISTFGGSAAAAAAAYANLKIIERDNLVERVKAMGEVLIGSLSEFLKHPNVGDVRGVGLLAGVEFVSSKDARSPLPEELVVKVAVEMAKLGVLVGRTNRSVPGGNNIINFAPAYFVTEEDVSRICQAFGEALKRVLG